MDSPSSDPQLLSDAVTSNTHTSLARELLQRLLHKDKPVDFRSEEQRLMVEHALSGQHNFVGILPTGGGKSLVYQIPAVAQPGQINLVVVSNKALMVDSLRKTKELGIPCCKWTSNSQDIGNAAVVFLAVESISSMGFRE
jgi:superfamily II DNA helicase RecQ